MMTHVFGPGLFIGMFGALVKAFLPMWWVGAIVLVVFVVYQLGGVVFGGKA